MAHEAEPTTRLRLPTLVFGLVEVRRLARELEALEDFMRQATLRDAGKQAALPRVSRLLDALATDNNLQLLKAADRAQLTAFLQAVQEQAPNLHISFAIDPSSSFTAKMVTWLRANIHPYALIEVGLQPTIAAGCIVRTTNKVFDFSLRNRFADAQGLLIKSLETTDGAQPAAVTTPLAVAPAEATMPAPVVVQPAPQPAAQGVAA